MILFLNGCSSSGKSTLAKAIQHLSDTPWLLLGIDTFFHMMPSKYVGFGEKADEGYRFVPSQDKGEPMMRVESGVFGKAVTHSIPKVIQTLAKDAHNLIVDEVLFSDGELEAYVQALTGYTVYFIGVMCDLKTLQEREILREDRALGLARDQFAHVHNRKRPYDLTVDTTHTSPFGCAEKILSFIKIMPHPQSFSS
ncbi:MAG: chloramphenicol phosphotransferase [Alphaproteobacteria bacterium]|nr:chloramphenicol phosphotransferase [Alphaproteobacteria bacterium]